MTQKVPCIAQVILGILGAQQTNNVLKRQVAGTEHAGSPEKGMDLGNREFSTSVHEQLVEFSNAKRVAQRFALRQEMESVNWGEAVFHHCLSVVVKVCSNVNLLFEKANQSVRGL